MNNQKQANVDKKRLSRRKLIKGMAAASGAAAASFVPKKWLPPMVETAVLPAHAQGSNLPPTSCEITTGLFRASLTWDTNANLELHVYEPCSFIDVAPVGFGGPIGDTIQHLGDNTDGSAPEEVVQIVPNEIYVGTYEIHPGQVSGPLPTNATLTIMTDTGQTVVPMTFDGYGYKFGTAEITYPGGAVTTANPQSAPQSHP